MSGASPVMAVHAVGTLVDASGVATPSLVTGYSVTATLDADFDKVSPKKWVLYGSSDNVNWDLVLHDQTAGVTWSAAGETMLFQTSGSYNTNLVHKVKFEVIETMASYATNTVNYRRSNVKTIELFSSSYLDHGVPTNVAYHQVECAQTTCCMLKYIAGGNHEAVCYGPSTLWSAGSTDTVVATPASSVKFSDIAWVGKNHMCGIDKSGPKVDCWGLDRQGLAFSPSGDVAVTVDKAAYLANPFTPDYQSLEKNSGNFQCINTCSAGGDLYCWGNGYTNGKIYTEAQDGLAALNAVAANEYTQVVALDDWTCGLNQSTDNVDCWKANDYAGTSKRFYLATAGQKCTDAANEAKQAAIADPASCKAMCAAVSTCTHFSYKWTDGSCEIGTCASQDAVGTNADYDIYLMYDGACNPDCELTGPYNSNTLMTFKSITAGDAFVCGVRKDDDGKAVCWGSRDVPVVSATTTSGEEGAFTLADLFTTHSNAGAWLSTSVTRPSGQTFAQSLAAASIAEIFARAQLTQLLYLGCYSVTALDLNDATQSYATHSPKEWKVYGSTDGSTWTEVDHATAQTGWTTGQTRWFTATTQTTAYTYFKLVFLDVDGTFSDSAGVEKWQVGLQSVRLYGRDNALERVSPINTAFGTKTYTAVAAGARHVCGLVTGTTYLECYGEALHSKADPTATAASSTSATLAATAYTALDCADEFCCAMKSDGVINCLGELTTSTVAADLATTHANSGGANVNAVTFDTATGVTCSSAMCCALLSSKPVCVGTWNAPVSPATSAAIHVVAEPTAAVQGFAFAGRNHICTVSEGRTAVCFGLYTQSADTADWTPPESASSHGFCLHDQKSSTNNYQMCFSDCTTEATRCWGINYSAKYVHEVFPSTVVASNASSVKYTNLVSSEAVTCGIRKATGDYKVDCWTATDDIAGKETACSCTFLLPTASPDLTTTQFAMLAAGDLFICGIEVQTAKVHCWGDNRWGQLSTPVMPQLSGPSVDVQIKNIALGNEHGCGIRLVDRAAVCWGNNYNGQCDAPDSTAFRDIAAGDSFSCGVVFDTNLVTCWGNLPASITTWLTDGSQVANPASDL